MDQSTISASNIKGVGYDDASFEQQRAASPEFNKNVEEDKEEAGSNHSRIPSD